MFTLIDTRNRHFLRAAQRIVDSLSQDAPIDLSAIAAQVASSPAPAYYCNYLYALRMLYVIRKSNIKLREGRRKALWCELNDKVNALLARSGGSVAEALNTVLSRGRASQFFISPVTAANLLRRYFDYGSRRFLIP